MCLDLYLQCNGAECNKLQITDGSLVIYTVYAWDIDSIMYNIETCTAKQYIHHALVQQQDCGCLSYI